MKKKVYAVQLSFEVQNEEKDLASKMIMRLDYLSSLLKKCDEYLDLIYTPFKNNPSITPGEIYKARAGLRRYRDTVADYFNTMKRVAFRCFIILKKFESDTQTAKLTKSFVSSISDIEKQVNRFIDLFGDLEANDFAATIVKAVENIKKEISQFEQIIEDRIKSHIEHNILARSWTDEISKELQEKVENKIPLSIQLVQERNKKLNQQES